MRQFRFDMRQSREAQVADNVNCYYLGFAAGDLVEVESPLTTNDAGQFKLQAGFKGTVIKVDDDGDVLINFDGNPGKHNWIKKFNLHKLRVICSGLSMTLKN